MKRRLLHAIVAILIISPLAVPMIATQTAYAAPAATTNSPAPEIDCPLDDLKWLFCPVVKGMALAVQALDNFINSQMSVGTPKDSSDPNQIFCNSKSVGSARTSCNAYYKAWLSVRNIALGLMGIAALIVLIAHALNFEILDAYTIRKVLPRLLICAVAITVSWQLTQFFVMLSNELAFGIRYIIYQPFVSLPDVSVGGGSAVAGGLLGLVAINALGFIGLLTFVGTALLAVFIAVLVLILRQILIILMVIISPIAIVAYILPNTQKLYKLWWESFSKALLMFALISGLIATGRVFSAVSVSSSDSPISQLAGFAAYFLPYFMIPATFKFAGGALRQIGGFVNDRSRGGFDRLRKARQDRVGDRIKRARSGGIYRDDFGQFKFRPGGKQHSVGKLANSFGNWTFDFDEQARVTAGQVPGPGRMLFGRSSDLLKGEIEDQRIEHSKKAAGALDLHYQSGRAISGQMQYFTEDGPLADVTNDNRRRLDEQFGTTFAVNEDGHRYATAWRGATGKGEVETIASILSNGGVGARLAAQELDAKAGAIGNLRGSEETRRADIETVGLISAAKSGRLENDDIVTRRKAMEEAPGHLIDRRQQPGYGAKEMMMLQDIATQKRTSQSRGHGIQFDANGQAYSVYADPTSKEAQTSLMRISTQDIAASKSEDIDTLANTMVYGASLYKMDYDKGSGKLDYVRDAAGKRQMKEGNDLDRAKALQSRIESLALYSYGDSDVGRKLANVADRAGVDMSRVRGADPRARDQGMPQPAAPPDPLEPPKP